MGRFILSFLICLLYIIQGHSQCPDLPNNVQVNGSNNLSFDLCGAQSATFTVNDPNLPTGTIDWYSSTTSGFDPTTGGILLGSSTIDSADPCDLCPSIESIYIDACGDEGDNEFMVIGSGSGFAVNDLSFTFDVANNGGSAGNGNINLGGVCSWTTGDLNLLSGCATLISVGPGDYIPPNSTVIVQTSLIGTTVYDISGVCGTSDCIYVLRNSCDRIIGGFSNCGAGTGVTSNRVNTLSLACGCIDQLTYDILDPGFLAVCAVEANGMHVFSDLTYANNGCNVGPNLASIPQFNFSAVTDPFNHTFTDADCNTTQFIVGVLESDQYNEDCCDEQVTEEYSFTLSCPTAELMGNANLCPGECEEISVIIVGGVPEYQLNLQVTGPLLPIPVTLPSFPLDGKITICYDNDGPLIDPVTNTVDIPSIPGGLSGGLNLLSFTDDTGCAGTVMGSSVSINLNNAPDINTPPALSTCDIGDGTGLFLLNDLDLIINGNTALTVNYYSDNLGLSPIVSPYQSITTTIFAQVMDIPCNSEIVPVDLEVISNGDAGIVNMFCNTSGTNSTECSICDSDGISGEDITLTIVFEDPTIDYDFEVVWTSVSGPSSTITGTSLGGSANITHTVFDITTFQVTLVTPDNDCPDMTDLGDPVIITYGIAPDMDNPGNLSNCGPVELPAITGTQIPANAGYYTQQNGMGTMFNPTDMITSDMTLYLYGGFENCEQEFSIDITIETASIIDPVADITVCGTYILPSITGTNIDNANYYTESGGAGVIVPVGQLITASSQLYIFDPICSGDEEIVNIMITPGSIITTGPDTTVCDTFILTTIEGMALTGNESYYESSLGSGQQIMVGDTFTSDTLIYIFDNTPGCNIEVPFQINVTKPQFPGLDSTVTICLNDPQLYDINQLLGGESADTTGFWIEASTSIIGDSTQVDFSSLPIGQYTFEYQITDTICNDTSSTLTIDILGIVDAGMDTVYAVCEDIMGVNVFELLGTTTNSGVFIDNLGFPAPFDPFNATFLSGTPGLEVYSYIVGDPLSACGADTSIFSVVTGDLVEAGVDVPFTLCAEEPLILSSILNGNSAIGYYSEPVISGAISAPGVFNSTLVSDGEYTVYHILDGSGQCPADTATITITVVDGPSAGDEQTETLCGQLSIDLTTIIDQDADPNGVYYLGNVELTDTEVDLTGITGEQIYLYIVGNGVTCPFDTAELTLQVATAPPFELMIDNTSICSSGCTTVTLNANSNGTQEITAYYSIQDQFGNMEIRTTVFENLTPALEIQLCEGIGLLTDNILTSGNTYTITYDSLIITNENCTFYPDLSVTVDVMPSFMTSFSPTFCNDTTIIIGPDTYDMIDFSGMTTLQSINGCDSIIDVNISFLNTVPGSFTNEYCDGEIISILGIEYSNDYLGDTLLIGASANGCDSFVSLDLTFLPLENQNRFISLCSGQDTMIGGILFNESMQSGTAIEPNGGSNGCDLQLNVNITYLPESTGILDTTVCSNFSIDINNNTYDIDMPTGMEILEGQATNGCDSMLMIDIDFSGTSMDSLIEMSTCDDNFFLQIGVVTFNRTNNTGEAISPGIDGDCDTLFIVDLTYGEMEVDLSVIDAGCEVVDSGFVIINEINGVPPYFITFNGNSASANLPFELQLPTGPGEITITDAGGCTSTQTFTILENEDLDFNIVANGNQLNIIGGEPDSVIWLPNDSISCLDCLNPIVNPESTTLYTATVFYGGDCIVELEYVFEVIDDIEDYILPNIFSPNNDGSNDNFKLVVTDGAIGVPELMEIYDRWGNKMNVTIGQDIVDIGWDGTANGNHVESGVYIYRIQIRELDRVINLYGDLTVIR